MATPKVISVKKGAREIPRWHILVELVFAASQQIMSFGANKLVDR